METKYRKIGLFDHMGLGNMGDAAIQESFITNIRKRLPEAKLVAFSLYPDDTRSRHQIESYPIRWSHPRWRDSDAPLGDSVAPSSRLKSFLKNRRILYALAKPLHDCLKELVHLRRSYRIVKSLDVLIMSGGGQLCELYGDLPYNVFKFGVVAKLAGTPVSIVGVGADLLKRPLNRFFARWSVRFAKYVSLRSAESEALIRSLGVKREIHVCPDPAYGLDLRRYLASAAAAGITPAQSRALLEKFCPAIGRQPRPDPVRSGDGQHYKGGRPPAKLTPTVGLNPIAFCDPRHWPQKDGATYDRYMASLVSFAEWLLGQNYHLEVFTTEITSDVYAIDDLKEGLLAKASSEANSKVSFRLVSTLNELFLQMSTFDYVVTSKFHGVIFSHLLGKPVIALSYLPKIDHLMRMVGHGQYCLAIDRCDANWLIGRFESLVREKELLTALFHKTSAAYTDALQAEFDRVLLPGSHVAAHEGYSNSIIGAGQCVSRAPTRR